ncbi:hypothetical protein AYI70_g4834 [Smittium culicis]|uniref:Uncharacterized protein n=1 Tax=Smittium culicis TaxID=133412 RepID=A0A1R1X1I1_9FUNG|nr:hypothetical protein AYI70_g11510 [Smittium culicis]OMJ19265.1 hypothetical protein AYI70_g4834 [Smittium culicis]
MLIVRDSICPGVSGYGSPSIPNHRNITACRHRTLQRATRSSSNRKDDYFKSPLSDISRKKFFAAVFRTSAMD